MTSSSYPGPESIRRHVLDNGITVLIYENPYSGTISLQGGLTLDLRLRLRLVPTPALCRWFWRSRHQVSGPTKMDPGSVHPAKEELTGCPLTTSENDPPLRRLRFPTRAPSRLLQEPQRRRRFDRSCVPPWTIGTMWSTVGFLLLPHSAQHGSSASTRSRVRRHSRVDL